VLGDDLALRASASPLETFRRARQFQLELRELGTPGAVIDGDAQRPDGRTSETRLQIDPTLAMRLSAREQTANTGERPSTSFTARLDWQPGGELTVDALLERTGGSSDSLRLMGHLTWRLAPARFSYEWQQVQQAGLTSQFERLATVIEPLTFGPFTLDLYGRLDRRSTQGGATTGSDLLGGNLRVSFGSTTLWLRHESNGRDGSDGRDGLSTVQLNVIPFERTSLRFTFDSSQKSNGAYAQGVTADLRIQASQTLNVLAGF